MKKITILIITLISLTSFKPIDLDKAPLNFNKQINDTLNTTLFKYDGHYYINVVENNNIESGTYFVKMYSEIIPKYNEIFLIGKTEYYTNLFIAFAIGVIITLFAFNYKTF